MNQRARTGFASALLLICWPAILAGQQIESYFSPNGGCAAAIAARIDQATKSVDVTAYQLTSAPLADALRRARSRGLTLRVVLDRAQEVIPGPLPQTLRSDGIELRTDHAEKLHHNKYAIIDDKIVITGSYNWSDNAEHANAENLIIITDPKTAAAFAADFGKHWQHAAPFVHHAPRKRTHRNPPATLSIPPHQPTQKGYLSWHAYLDPSTPTQPPARSAAPLHTHAGKADPTHANA